MEPQPASSLEAKALTNAHYDQEPRLFELLLDDSLKYSAGLFTSPEMNLNTAQLAKLAYVSEALRLRRGARVLDVGCGWGSLVNYVALHHGVEVTGITPSPRQAEFVRGRAERLGIGSSVDIKVGTFDEVTLENGSFDAITMLGSLVHFPDKRAAVRRCFELCRRRARVYFSESCFRNAATKQRFDGRPGTVFVREGIFGWGELLPLSTYLELFESAGFSLIGARDLTADYAKTIEEWIKNVERNRDALEALESGTAERYLRYFSTANAGWGFTTKHYALILERSR